ncbi:MAG: EipA family protein, partial [Alphaproteobacteria bacterium]
MNTFTLSRYVRTGMAALAMSGLVAGTAAAQANSQYSAGQLVAAGNDFFGQVAGNVASALENAIDQFGLPNGYILGQTVGGAFVGGIRYGEGTLYTQNIGSYPVYWQGPSIGFDIGVDASRTMMLVYNLPSI